MSTFLSSISRQLLLCVIVAINPSLLFGDESGSSPWLLVPVVSSDPKVGTSAGVFAGYLHQFDDQSPVSTFGVGGGYSNTDSYGFGIYVNAYLAEDTHRVTAGVGIGKIRNDFSDFLGSGLPVQTTDDLRFAAARYLYRVRGNWFVGAQFSMTNYLISGANWQTDAALNLLGLTGFDSNGIGLVAEHDTRDNQNSPKSGHKFSINNLAYRDWLGGDDSFDTYTMKYRQYLAHGDDHVLAWRAEGRATHNAPRGGYSSVGLRGYVRGNNLAPHMMLFEVEERYKVNAKWGLAGFTGAVCLLDDLNDCGQSSNWYPNIGAGLIYTIKPAEKMVVRLDYAWGKSGNQGLYMSFGHAF
ncbi:MAG: BamA/TamA family outer membrane protein [Pseudomonadales bacterium]|nr:BamA/TamA family outer membrane protein [Pseudomonadales bacterium]